MDKCLHIISRAVAKERGMKRYFTGKACKRGYFAERQSTNGACYCQNCCSYRHEATKSYKAQWYHDNKDHCKEKAKEQGKEVPPEKRREWTKKAYDKAMKDPEKRERKLAESRRWKSKNKERLKEYRVHWYNNNRSHCVEYSKEYARKNPDKCRVSRDKRRAAVGQYTESDIHALLTHQRHKCASCRVSVKKIGYHVDHVIPLARGGTNWPDNLQILCPTCNMSKGAKDPIEWAQQCGRLL